MVSCCPKTYIQHNTLVSKQHVRYFETSINEHIIFEKKHLNEFYIICFAAYGHPYMIVMVTVSLSCRHLFYIVRTQ